MERKVGEKMQFQQLHQIKPVAPYKLEENQMVLEASGDYATIDVKGQSMSISLINDERIEDNNLPEVTDPLYFKAGGIPSDGGLFSPIIFGDTPKEKRMNHAYINLKQKFFHPYIYEVLVQLSRKVKTVVEGKGSWVIENGELIEIKDENDPLFNEDHTGLGWLITHFRELEFKETDAQIRKERIELLNSLPDESIFITKWIVIPVFYRDYDRNGRTSIPEINYMYCDILKNVRSLDTEFLSIAKNMTMAKIQLKLVEIRQFGQSLMEKKNGFLQKSILGKAEDYGSRGVISVPSMNYCDVPNDCLVDITHSGVPLSKCLELATPFIMKWVSEFFEDQFRNVQTMPVMIRSRKDGSIRIENKEIIDQMEIYTTPYIMKKMEMFKKTFGFERFETIKIKCKDGTETELVFTGKGYERDPENPAADTISTRPMTWTDIFYLAAENMLSDKYCYITRYPLIDYFGIFPSKVAVLSTIRTSPVIFNGKVYPHYPVIDLSLKPEQVARQFIDTFSISNLYLDAIGGDYDGDTVSAKILFSIEANKEAEEAINNISHYISIQGNMIRVIGNESYLTFYNMTRRE